jgi:hypothetical protein
VGKTMPWTTSCWKWWFFVGHLWFYGHDWGIVYCSHIMAGHLLVITSVITGHKWDYAFHNGVIGC